MSSTHRCPSHLWLPEALRSWLSHGISKDRGHVHHPGLGNDRGRDPRVRLHDVWAGTVSRKGFPRWFLGFSLRGLSAEKEEPALAEALQRHEGVVLGGCGSLEELLRGPGCGDGCGVGRGGFPTSLCDLSLFQKHTKNINIYILRSLIYFLLCINATLGAIQLRYTSGFWSSIRVSQSSSAVGCMQILQHALMRTKTKFSRFDPCSAVSLLSSRVADNGSCAVAGRGSARKCFSLPEFFFTTA